MFTASQRIEYDAELQKNLPRNFLAHSLDMGFYFTGLAFVSVETVLPPIIRSLGGADWLISLLPFFLVGGISLPAIFVGPYIDGLQWKKPLIIVCGLLQRLPFLLAGLALLFLGSGYPVFVVYFVAFTPAISSFMFGFAISAWQELLAKTIPPERRASVMGTGMFAGSAAGLLAGVVVAAVLERWPNNTGYAYLHFLGFSLMMFSYAGFLILRETRMPIPVPTRKPGIMNNLQTALELWREDIRLRRYIICRAFANGVFMIVPFISLRAMKVLDVPESHLGFLVIASVIGGAAGNICVGIIGDKLGSRAAILFNRGCSLIMCLLLVFARHEWMFLTVFFLLGASRYSDMISHNVYSMDLAPEHRRPSTLGVIIASALPSMLIIGLASALIWTFTENFMLVNGLTVITIIISTLLFLRIPEPQRQVST